MASVRLFGEPATSGGAGQNAVSDAAQKPKSLVDIAQSENLMREREAIFEPKGVDMAKLSALNAVSEHYSSLLEKIGKGEPIGDGSMDATANSEFRKLFKTENGETKYTGKIPLADLGVFLGVRNGVIQPNEKTLPYIIQSMTAVASDGNVLGDFEGKRFMQFQSRFDKRNHRVKSGVDTMADSAIKDRTWTPEATFEALQKHFDTIEEEQATRLMLFNKRLLAESCGLKDGEDYFKLDHDRQLEIANNLSGIWDRKWLTTRIDAALQKFLTNDFADINEIEGGDIVFDRLLNGDGFADNVKQYVNGFLDAVQNGDYYRSREQFAKYLYENGFEHTKQYLQAPSHFGSFGTTATTTYTDKQIDDGDETLKAVKNDDGSYSLMVKRGGRYDREVNFKNEVLGAYKDEDGRYAAAEAIAALNQNPEAWTIVNRAIDTQGVAIASNGIDANQLLKSLLDFYDKDTTKEWHEHAREVANSVVTAMSALDTEVGAMYAESGIGRIIAGALNTVAQFGATTTEYFRDDDFSDVAMDFASRHSDTDKAEAFAYLESMRSTVYNLTTKRIFDDGTLVGGAAQFWMDIYGLGKVFELGQLGLGATIEMAGRGGFAAATAGAAKLGTRAAKFSLATQKFGRAMQGVKNMRLVNELKDFNKSVKEVRQFNDMSLVEKASRIQEMHDTFLAKVAMKYGGDKMVEINKYVDALAKFIGKIPALGAMYNSDTDNAYLQMLQDTTVLDDNEFTAEEQEALMGYAREKGGVTAVMMAGLLHVFPKGFRKIMGHAKGELGLEADALDKMFLAICKGQEGLSTLTPENQFLFRACISTAMSRASREAAMNGAFIFTMDEANLIIDNNRRIWEKQRLDPNYKPTVYDMLRGSGDALWEGGKAALTAGLPMAALGGMGGVRGARGKVNQIRNTRYGLAKEEIASTGKMKEAEADMVLTKALLGLEQARRMGDAKAEEAIYSDIRKVGGAKGVQFMRQLDYAIRKSHGDRNIGYRTQLEYLAGQDFSVDGLKKTLGRVGLSHSTVEDLGDGRMLVTIGKGDIDAMVTDKGASKPLKIVVAHSTVPVRDSTGEFSKAFVKTVQQMLDSGEVAGRVKEIWDSLTPKQKRRAIGANSEGEVTQAPRNTKGIWSEAERFMNDSGMMRGVFLESKDATKAGRMSNADANLYDGLVVLSQGSDAYEEAMGRSVKALRSLENIRRMAAKATGNGGASIETFIHEMFHAVTELLPLDAKLREDLKTMYGREARGGDWRENFVDHFLETYTTGVITNRQMTEAEREQMSLIGRVASAAGRLLRGLFGRDVKPEDRAGEEGIKEFVSEVVKAAPDEAKTMREIEEMERNIDRNIEEMRPENDGGLFDFGKERQKLLEGYDVDGAIGAAIEIEKEVASGERGYYIVGRGTAAGRRAVALSNLADGRNLLVGAHVVANRFGTLDLSEPQDLNERSRRDEINGEIEAYAKRQRAYTGSVDGSMAKMGAKYLASGSEADVWLAKDRACVYKAITPDTLYDGDMRLMLDRIALHNYVSPEAPLKIIGFGKHKGALNVIVKQPYFEAGSLETLTQKGLYAAMEDAGFKRVSGAHITDHGQEGEEVWMSRDRQFVIGDLAARNVSVSGNSLRIIDCAAYKNTPWLRDRANIPEKFRPRGQQTYDEVKQAMRERETSAMVEFYENMGLTHEDAVKKAGGLYQIVGYRGLDEMCGTKTANKVMSDVVNSFFDTYNKEFHRVAFDSEAVRTGKDTVQRKRVDFSELNKAAGKREPIAIKTKAGVTIHVVPIFGGTGYISAERWRGQDEIYSLSGLATGDSAIRFVFAGESAKIPHGMMNELVNPKTAKQLFLGDFFFNKRANKFVSGEAQAMFDAYGEQVDIQHGQEVRLPSLALTPVYILGSDAYKEYKDANKRFVSEPWFGDSATRERGGRFSSKRNMVLVDNLGSVIIHPDANNEQIAAGVNEAMVRNVQLREHWEKPATRGSVEFYKNIGEEASKDLHRYTQLFRIGSGRLRNLILDTVKAKMEDARVKGNEGRNSWFERNFDEISDRITETLNEVFRNSFEYFASEVEAHSYAGSFIDRKQLQEARERGKTENVPVSMQFINDRMLDSIGAMAEWQDRGLVDARGSHVPSVEQSRRVIEFYKSVVAKAVESVLHSGGNDRKAERQWFTRDFGEAADKMFRDYVSRKIDADRKALEDYRNAEVGYDAGGATKVSRSDVDSIGSEADPMVRLVVDFLRSEGVESLAMLNDGKSEYFKELDRLAREDSGKDATDADIVNNKMSAIRTAMSLYSIEGERALREENRRLGAKLARAQAHILKTRAIHNAKGLTRAEVDARLGLDSIAVLAGLPEGTEKDLAKLIETNALAYIKNSREEFRKQSPEEFLKNPIAIAEFGATVASWLGNAARTLSFGQTRENAKRDIGIIRQYTERPNLERIRGMLVQNIAAIAYQHNRHRVSDIIDRIDACIDKNAMGRQGVVVDKELYKRKVEPRIQQYWKDVKEVMRLTPDEVAKEMEAIGGKYGDFAEALTDIAEGKGSDGIVPTEETLLARDLAQLRYVALHRYGGLAHKMLGEVSDAVETVAVDIELAQQRVANMVGRKLEQFEADSNALVKGCLDFRRGEKDGKYELSKVGKGLRAAMYFNSPDLFRKLKMYFKEGSEAYEVCEQLRRDMSVAHIEMERVIAEYETAVREAIPAIFKQKYGDISFEKLAGILHEKVEEYEEFSRTGWRIPAKGGDVVDFNTGRVYEADVAEYTVDVKGEGGKTVHKKGDKVASTVKLGADGRLLDAAGNEIAKTVHKKGDAIIEKITLAVGMDDPRHDGSGHNSRLSLADLIYIYAARRQGDMRKNNAIYGCDEAYMRRLEDAIGPEGIAVADWMVEHYEQMRKQLSLVSERITGMPVMSPDVMYIPLRFEGDPSVNATTRYKIDAFPSFLTRRQNHDTKVLREATGIFDIFSKRVAESAHYMAFSDVIERVKATFCDKRVEGAYRELLGDAAFKQMYRQLFESLSGGVREPDGWFGRLRNFTTATTLFLNVPSAIKQFEGIAAYSSVMGIGHWMGNLHHLGSAYGLLSQSSRLKAEEFKRALKEVGDPLATRKLEGYSDYIVALKEANEKAENRGDTLASNPLTRFYNRNGLVLTTKIDALASASMGCAFFNQRLALHMKKGLTVEEARRAAIADLDYAIQETQQSSRREFLLDPQSGTGRWGVGGRLLTQFAGPAFIRFGMELEALHRAVYIDKNPKAWRDLVNKVIALHIVCPTALSLLGLGAQSIVHRADDEDWAAKAVRDWCVSLCLGPLSGWFIVGSALNYTTQSLANGFLDENIPVAQLRNGSPMLSKVFDLTRRTSKIAAEVLDGMREGDMDTDKVAEEVGGLIDALLPIERVIKRAAKNLSDL